MSQLPKEPAAYDLVSTSGQLEEFFENSSIWRDMKEVFEFHVKKFGTDMAYEPDSAERDVLRGRVQMLNDFLRLEDLMLGSRKIQDEEEASEQGGLNNE